MAVQTMTRVTHIEQARIADIEDRLDRFKWAIKYDERQEGSITDLFLGRDVPWLLERVRQCEETIAGLRAQLGVQSAVASVADDALLSRRRCG